MAIGAVKDVSLVERQIECDYLWFSARAPSGAAESRYAHRNAMPQPPRGATGDGHESIGND